MASRFESLVATVICLICVAWGASPMTGSPVAQAQSQSQSAQPAAAAQPDDPVRTLVARLELERYKATIKSLTQFGDRRQGTDRNRAANDWIEKRLVAYGCSGVDRITYEYAPAPRTGASTQAARGEQAGAGRGSQAAAGAGAAGSGSAATGAGQARGRIPIKGNRGPAGVNNDPEKQPDVALRELDMQPTSPGERQEVFATKIGSTRPDEMYIVSGHMDGLGYSAAANDNASGAALVLEVARILCGADVVTERSVRFALWNNEETGLNGARAYAAQRGPLQGKEDPPGSGKYPEPKWLGVIAHDMMLFDHGMPGPDGKVSSEQRPEADVNIEFAGTSKMAAASQDLAWAFKNANDLYATDYPAVVGNRMSNTDSAAFQDLVASISLREAERLSQVGAGWDPTWHQPIDVFQTFSDKDFRLGLNAAQTTLAAIAQLVGAKVK
ncbi:MAG: M28 family peptidase [Vicinamibacterales bacterium]